jgi:sugar-specific transcriptional regulator TrmB
MEKLSNHIITVLQEVKHPVVDNSISNSVSIIQGRQNIYTRIGRMINEATGTVYLVSTMEDIMKMYYTSIPEMIEKSRKNGGIIRIITDSENKQAAEFIKKIGATETRHGKLPSSGRIVAEKDKQIIMSGSMKETMELNDEADSIIHTSSIEMVNNIFSLCEHLWEKSNQSISKKT